MTTRSLHVRLLLLQGLAVLLALALTGYGLNLLFTQHIERRVSAELDAHLRQLAAGVAFDEQGRLRIARPPAAQRFGRIFSGLYWQVLDETDGRQPASRSLWDERLDIAALPAGPQPRTAIITAPDGRRLLVRLQRLIARHDGRDRPLRLAVAIDRAELDALSAAFRRDMVIALGLLALFLILAGWAQTTFGLKPLSAIRRAIAAIRTGRARRITAAAPREITPLIDEFNALLEAQEAEMTRARNRAADLAHGLRTPLTAMKAEAARLKRMGQHEIAASIDNAVSMMSRQVERQLAAARPSRRGETADVMAALKTLVNTLQRTPRGEIIDIRVRGPAALPAALGRDHVVEILGNLLDNALRHAASRVDITARASNGRVRVHIADDGPGIPLQRRAEVLARGRRLDERGSGAGLGLAIVDDLLVRHGGALRLEESALGGLLVVVDLPAV